MCRSSPAAPGKKVDQVEFAERLSQQLSAPDGAEGFAPVFIAALQELVRGRPVPVALLGRRLVLPPAMVADLLRRVKDTEWDEHGSLLGYGLTLKPTTHRFEVEGLTLHTWCAFDTLFFPALIGKPARAISKCMVTGRSVCLGVSPERLISIEPGEAAISMVLPAAGSRLRENFCCNVHFFESKQTGEAWAEGRPDMRVMSVQSGFDLGLAVARNLQSRASAALASETPDGSRSGSTGSGLA